MRNLFRLFHRMRKRAAAPVSPTSPVPPLQGEKVWFTESGGGFARITDPEGPQIRYLFGGAHQLPGGDYAGAPASESVSAWRPLS